MATQRQTQRREDILRFLQIPSPEGGATARKVSEALSIHYTTANDDLNVLMHQGKVRAEGGPSLRTPRTWSAV